MRLLIVAAALFAAWAGPAFGAEYSVTTTADSGTGSLRDAIVQANGNGGDAVDTITFALPATDPIGGPYTISLLSALPFITTPVTIDGETQPGWIGPPIVELRGSGVGAGDARGFYLAPGSDGSTIRGLAIDGFPLDAIGIKSSNNRIANNYLGIDPVGTIRGNNDGVFIEIGSANLIGGSSSRDRNVISGNHGGGIYIAPGIGTGNDANVIRANYIGLSPGGGSGEDGNNGAGITVYAAGTTIAGNVISANAPNVWILGSSNVLNGNRIGTDSTGLVGAPRSGGVLVSDGATGNQIGRPGEGGGNLISGNGPFAVRILGSTTTGNLVQGDTIGPDARGGDSLRSSNSGPGVDIQSAKGNLIGGSLSSEANEIAFNAGNGGVVVSGSGVQNSISGNSIHDNGGLGIELAADGIGVTPNDPGDADSGPNNLQNFPTVTEATSGGVSGELSTAASGDYRIEVFASPSCDSSGGNGEGQTYLGSASVSTNPSGFAAWAIDATVSDGDILTATATSGDGNTSEFSECFTAELGGGTTTTDTSSTSTTTAAPPAADGSGSLTTPLAPVTAGSAGNKLTFTYTAADGGMNNGSLILTVPAGWSAPSTNSGDAGYTTASTGSLTTDAPGIYISSVTLAGGETLTITYGASGGANAPPSPVTQSWLAQQRSTPTGTFTSLTPPSVVVGPAASGADSLVFGTPPPGVARGGTMSITGNTLRLNALPGKADIEIAIDTTSSMGASIAQAKTDATNLVTSVHNDIPDAQFSVVQFRDAGDSPAYAVVQPMTSNAASVQAAINGLSPGGGGDLPEAYNTVFQNSYTPALGGDIGWRSGSRKLVVVIGDAQPHGALSSAFPGCANVPVDGLSTATELAGMRTNQRTLFMMRQAATASTTLQCYQSLAAAAYDGGQGVDAGTSLGAQIVGLVQSASAHVSAVTFTTATPGFTFTPAAAVGPLDAPVTTHFDGSFAVGADVAPGTHTVSVTAVGDGVARATGSVDIVVKAPLSNLSMSVTPSTVGAGITTVSLSNIPNAWLAFFSGSANGTAGPPLGAPPTASTPVGSVPVGSVPVGSVPVGSVPVGSVPVGSVPVGSVPVGSVPVGSVPVGSVGLLDLPVGSIGISSLLLSQLPLCGDVQLPGADVATCKAHGATWAQVLASTPFATRPLNSLSLADVLSSTTVHDRLATLHLNEVSFVTTLLQSVRWTSLLLGPAHLLSLPVPAGFGAWCGGATPVLPTADCSHIGAATSVLQADIEGHLGSAPVGSIPVGSIDPNAVPVGSVPVGSVSLAATNIAASKLASVRLSDISATDLPSIVNCGLLDPGCATKTLGDAYTAHAIYPAVLFSSTKLTVAFQHAGITVNDILAAIINTFGTGGLPWETLPLQGLQPYSASPPHVTYTMSATVDCSVARSFSLSAKLPPGFFPVGTATKTLTGLAAGPAGPPTVEGDTAAEAQKLNQYTWTMSCGDASTAVTASLSFDAYVGLKLGTFSARAEARSGSFTLTMDGSAAPVTVTQNGEPGNDSAATARTVATDTLVVGHIAASGDQDFYTINLNGLARGTKLAAFLHTPTGADFDLTVSKAAAAAFFSSPVGSVPVGSIPIEDSGVGFTNGPLPADTLQDVPVGSVPVGSVPVGSVPVGSVSTNRGDANEAAQIITDGQGGVATIGVSGYNGASSTSSYALRIRVTPPPPIPATCPARPFAPTAANQGSLPGSLPATTKSLFIVNKQRLMAMFGTTQAGATAVNTLLTRLTTLAARPEVAGSVLQVDGNAAVRSAYAAWDANPCNPALANNVVRSINDVVAGYRNTQSGLPNLHYIVLTGTDELTPMARTPDPVTLSPEENVAADLAFTTSGLTAGNALYNSAAENDILTDGAYGAFLSIPWLGHDLLLPQVSVSRLVETPSDMLGQVNRYLATSGYAGTPQTGVGTLNPQKLLTTGYDFLADGSQAIHDNLHANFPGAAQQDTIGGHSAINTPGSPTPPPWTAPDIFGSFFQPAGAADIASINAHYNHYELQAADNSIGTTGDPSVASAAIQARVLFTMGCHGGLSVADALGGLADKLKDWPQIYSAEQAAVYIGNTGFGYGDSESIALSERLLALFAKNLHSDASSVGEQWAAALQQYFATAGAYDVYDEKVMEETTFYGLPFWHFSTAGTSPVYTPPATSPDPVIGTPSATLTITPSASDQSQFGLYRPIERLASREVTSAAGPARGLWIAALSTTDSGADAVLGMPTIDLKAHEPKPSTAPIFFPASPFTLEHSTLFGKQRDYANVSGQFRPAPTSSNPSAGTNRTVTSATLRVLYSTAADQVAPLISQVNVLFNGTTVTVQAHVTDDSGLVAEVAALVNDGSWHVVQLFPSPDDPTLFTPRQPISVIRDPEVFVEATDGANVSYSANKGSNFTSTSSAPPAGPPVLIQSPVGPYGGGTTVNASYSCPGATSCVGTVANGQPIDTTPGLHSFRVTATDASGEATTVQRTYLVGDLALAVSVSPSAGTTGTLVVASASLTNTAAVARDVTLSATFAYNTSFVFNSPPLTIRVPAQKTFGGGIPFRIPKNMPRGTYVVVLRASDAAGTVTATATLVVT